MKQEEVRFDTYNTDSDYQVLIVSYGTMSRVCRTAIDNMKKEGFRSRHGQTPNTLSISGRTGAGSR